MQLELTTTVRHQNELLVTFCARLAALPKVMTRIRAVVVKAVVAPAAVYRTEKCHEMSLYICEKYCLKENE